MSAPYSTHIPRLEVLLALRANRQPRIGELNVQLLFKAGWRKGQDVLGGKFEIRGLARLGGKNGQTNLPHGTSLADTTFAV